MAVVGRVGLGPWLFRLSGIGGAALSGEVPPSHFLALIRISPGSFSPCGQFCKSPDIMTRL